MELCLCFSLTQTSQADSLAWRYFSHLSLNPVFFSARTSHHSTLTYPSLGLFCIACLKLEGLSLRWELSFVCFPSLMCVIVLRNTGLHSVVVTLLWRPDWKGQWKWSASLHSGWMVALLGAAIKKTDEPYIHVHMLKCLNTFAWLLAEAPPTHEHIFYILPLERRVLWGYIVLHRSC